MRLALRIAAGVALALALGCSTVPQPPKATATAGEVAITQAGTAAEPVRATTTAETRSMPIPAGSEVVFNDQLGTITVRLVNPTRLDTTRRTDTAEGPRAFTPSDAPTPAQITAGRAGWLYRIGLVAGVALFGLGLGWGGKLVWMGGACVAGASAFGWFVEDNPWLLAVIGGGTTLAAAGWLVWQFWLKDKEISPAPKSGLAPAAVAPA